MQSDIKAKLGIIKDLLFKQETCLKDQEHIGKELGTRLSGMRATVK